MAAASDGERQERQDGFDATTAVHALMARLPVDEDADDSPIETLLQSDGLCIFIRPFLQLSDGCRHSAAHDDEDGCEFLEFRRAIIHDRERCAASRLNDDPVVGEESLACDYGGLVRDHDTAKRVLFCPTECLVANSRGAE